MTPLYYGSLLQPDQLEYFSADSSYCWAYSISSMLRHSLNLFLRKWKKKYPVYRSYAEWARKIDKAVKYLNDPEFHKRLRSGFKTSNCRKSCLRAIGTFLIIFYQNLTKRRIINDSSSKAQVCRDKCSYWKIQRRLQKRDNWYAKSCFKWCHW